MWRSWCEVLTAVDHLLVGTANLDQGIRWVHEQTGVTAAIGGSHPGWGTRNALLSLGAEQYLEVIAPDLTQTSYSFKIDVRTVSAPKLITWAARTTDLDAVARQAKAAGHQVFRPVEGWRVRPDGRRLAWRMLRLASTFAVDAVDPIPFFIEWSRDTVHPSFDAPQGCSLKELRMTHPSASAVTAVLKAVGIEIEVTTAVDATIYATLDTPNGLVCLH